jgi:hypothetical protein
LRSETTGIGAETITTSEIGGVLMRVWGKMLALLLFGESWKWQKLDLKQHSSGSEINPDT